MMFVRRECRHKASFFDYAQKENKKYDKVKDAGYRINPGPLCKEELMSHEKSFDRKKQEGKADILETFIVSMSIAGIGQEKENKR